jgi:uncharacterized protein with PIN domain
MLGSLARKLRIFGYDTLYFRDGSDAELERLAIAEDRVIVTADRGLAGHSNRHGVRVLAVEGESDRERLVSLLAQARSTSLALRAGSPRCAVCNSGLERVGRGVAEESLPAAVTSRHRLYYRCQACRKLYWRGGHWRRLAKLSSVAKQR